jgi:hypothetical protein
VAATTMVPASLPLSALPREDRALAPAPLDTESAVSVSISENKLGEAENMHSCTCHTVFDCC